jgi:hypothetical protein
VGGGRVSPLVVDPDNTGRYLQLRGHVELIFDGALEHLDALTRQYTRHPAYYGYATLSGRGRRRRVPASPAAQAGHAGGPAAAAGGGRGQAGPALVAGAGRRLAAAVLGLPEQLRRLLTWDHGREMAEHLQFTIDSGVQVYVCAPHSPWRRGTNENTNGLLRQYLPRVPTYGSSTRPAWIRSRPSSIAALDNPSASRHPHADWRRRCPDPLTPPTIPRQPPLPTVRHRSDVQNPWPKSTSRNRLARKLCDHRRRLLCRVTIIGPSGHSAPCP